MALQHGQNRRVRFDGASMYRIKHSELPLHGSSHNFVGAEHGDVNVAVFLCNGLPGNSPGPHRHPYDEVQFRPGAATER